MSGRRPGAQQQVLWLERDRGEAPGLDSSASVQELGTEGRTGWDGGQDGGCREARGGGKGLNASLSCTAHDVVALGQSLTCQATLCQGCGRPNPPGLLGAGYVGKRRTPEGPRDSQLLFLVGAVIPGATGSISSGPESRGMGDRCPPTQTHPSHVHSSSGQSQMP